MFSFSCFRHRMMESIFSCCFFICCKFFDTLLVLFFWVYLNLVNLMLVDALFDYDRNGFLLFVFLCGFVCAFSLSCFLSTEKNLALVYLSCTSLAFCWLHNLWWRDGESVTNCSSISSKILNDVCVAYWSSIVNLDIEKYIPGCGLDSY